MKRFLSIVAVLALVFSLAVPALAAEKSPVGDDLIPSIATSSSERPSDAEIGEGYTLLGVWDVVLVHPDGTEATAEEVADFFAKYGSIDIDFSKYVSQNPDKVLHKIGGSWKSESFSGRVVTGVTSLSPFAFLVKDDADGPSDKSDGKSEGKSEGKTSPQTGSDAILWAISAAAMMLAAGYCLSRKKAAE